MVSQRHVRSLGILRSVKPAEVENLQQIVGCDAGIKYLRGFQEPKGMGFIKRWRVEVELEPLPKQAAVRPGALDHRLAITGGILQIFPLHIQQRLPMGIQTAQIEDLEMGILRMLLDQALQIDLREVDFLQLVLGFFVDGSSPPHRGTPARHS